MTTALLVLGIFVCVVLSGVYSGSETGCYKLSRTALDLEAADGNRSARLASWLMRNDTALLVTILIGNNLVLETASLLAGRVLHAGDMEGGAGALLVTVVLSPILFLFGETLPKELFRRRPRSLVFPSLPILALSRVVFWPLERVLTGMANLLGRMLGLEDARPVLISGRAAVADFIEEGRRQGALSERAEVLARNALELRSIAIERCMVPWSSVAQLSESSTESERREVVRMARHSRLPIVASPGGPVTGYAHQLEVLLAGLDADPLDYRRDLIVLAPGTPVGRALFRLRGLGQRTAAVGEPGSPPIGLVTLKDLVEEISGDLEGL
jgi:putative hemolysin